HGVCASPRGGIWATTSRGLCYFNGKTATNFTTENGMTSPYIKRVLEARDGDVYFISASRAVEILSRGKVVAHHYTGAWPVAMAEDASGVVVSFGSELFRVSRGGIVPFPFHGKAPDFFWIRNLATAKDGSLLVACVNGVFRIKGDTVEHWSTNEGLIDADVLCVSGDDDGTIWAGSTTGITRIKDKVAKPISPDLLNNLVMAIVPDNHGNLWLNTSYGIIRVSRRSLNTAADGKASALDETVYDSLESVKTIDTTDVECVGCNANDGTIWFPTPQGAVRIDPDNILPSPAPSKVIIQKVVVNGVETTSENAKVNPGKGELSFQYAALNLVAPQKIQFRYKLENYDTDWIEAGTRRNASYANLRPRNYTFHVQSRNADGIWNTRNTSFQVVLPPHYYQAAWFRLFIGICVALGLSGIYVWRTGHLRHKERKLQAANELLESKISERTQELADQRNLLRTLIDHLPDEIFVKDLKGRVIIDNLAHARSFGVEDPNDAVGKTDFDCLSAENAEQFRRSEVTLL
ncbi:MAG TPA: triple tyrosine motif-containing protein, partial [Candidatus Paceibacterota bacterium]|nr:triple tyrosine motif-containing protein [Candidatus Paceibacterota bacterium]